MASENGRGGTTLKQGIALNKVRDDSTRQLPTPRLMLRVDVRVLKSFPWLPAGCRVSLVVGVIGNAVTKWTAMTTFEEAYDAAASWLDERGLLLNSQLLQMVTGDEGLRDEVRALLLSDGVAIDRYGIGLVRGEQPIPSRTLRSDEGPSEILFAEATDASLEERFQETGPVSDESAEAEWWLMAGGATRGPFMLEALQRLRRRGDVADTHLVRQGERGLWRSPHDVEELAEFVQLGPSEQRSLAIESPVAYRTGTEEPFTKDGRSASLSSSRPSGSVSRPDTEPRRSEVERRDGSVPRRAASPAPEPSRHAELNGSEGSGGAIDDECEFFLWEGGRPVGPVSRTDLQERLANGLLLADEFVQVGVDGEWQPVAKALNVRRPPLKNPDRSRDTGGEDSKSPSHSADSSNSTTALNNKGFGSPVSTTGATRAASRKASPSANSTSSPIDATTNVGRVARCDRDHLSSRLAADARRAASPRSSAADSVPEQSSPDWSRSAQLPRHVQGVSAGQHNLVAEMHLFQDQLCQPIDLELVDDDSFSVGTVQCLSRHRAGKRAGRNRDTESIQGQ